MFETYYKEKNEVKILGPMVDDLIIIGCFHMERPLQNFERKQTKSTPKTFLRKR
jgi:hypothetical protein